MFLPLNQRHVIDFCQLFCQLTYARIAQVFYAAEVLLALQYLHILGCTYRDLKPENILLMADGHARITDFDLCLLKRDFQPTMVKTLSKTQAVGSGCRRGVSTHSYMLAGEPEVRTNSFVGTEEYLSPEVIMGTTHGPAVDWWSLGILIYELVYGFTPFKGSRRGDTFDNIMKVRVLSTLLSFMVRYRLLLFIIALVLSVCWRHVRQHHKGALSLYVLLSFMVHCRLGRKCSLATR